jgi:hypothetical protein
MTLAQRYIENSQPFETGNPHLDALVGWTDHFIMSRLYAPKDAELEHLKVVAERFVFEEPAADVVDGLVKAGQIDRRTVIETLVLPYSNMWIEMPMPMKRADGEMINAQIGYMIGRVVPGDSALLPSEMNVCAITIYSPAHGKQVTPLCLFELPEFPLKPTTGTDGHTILNYRPFFFGTKLKPDEKHSDEMDHMLSDLFDALFFLTVPRAVEYSAASFGPRKAKVQARTGKPFVEFRKVHIKIGSSVTRYPGVTSAGSAGGEAGKRKLHRVGTFLRTYRKGREQPHVVALDPFWRGDPKLGVIIKEKHYHGEAEAAKQAKLAAQTGIAERPAQKS